MKITNGTIWRDTDGNVLHAHGGYIIKHGGVYYWYGENRLENFYVDCYCSEDLVNWTFRNHVLTADSRTENSRVRADLRLRTRRAERSTLSGPRFCMTGRRGGS